MPDWVKIIALMLGLAGWSATVIATLWQGKIPDLGLLGIPAGLILAFAPPLRITRGRANADDQAADETESEAS